MCAGQVEASGHRIGVWDSTETSKCCRHLHLFTEVYNDKLFGVVGCEA